MPKTGYSQTGLSPERGGLGGGGQGRPRVASLAGVKNQFYTLLHVLMLPSQTTISVSRPDQQKVRI